LILDEQLWDRLTAVAAGSPSRRQARVRQGRPGRQGAEAGEICIRYGASDGRRAGTGDGLAAGGGPASGCRPAGRMEDEVVGSCIAVLFCYVDLLRRTAYIAAGDVQNSIYYIIKTTNNKRSRFITAKLRWLHGGDQSAYELAGVHAKQNFNRHIS
jgi:hypothetical protein